jgi:hypothetical protein
MLNQLKRFVLLAIFTTPVIISCGVSNPLKEGYYVSSSTSDSYYPLVVVKVTGGSTHTYRVSQRVVGGLGGFNSGSEVDTSSESSLTLGFEIESDGSASYTGYVTQKGTQLRVRALKLADVNAHVDDEKDVAKHTVLKDELLSPISKTEAITELNKLVKRTGKASDQQEEECQGAFGMSCSTLFN